MPRLVARTLFDDGDLRIAEVACDGDDATGRRGEVASDDHVVAALRGRFAVRGGRRPTVVDPATAAVFRTGEEHEFIHPHGGGDVCVAVRGSVVRASLDRLSARAHLDARGQAAVQRLAVALRAGAGPPSLAIEETIAGALAGPGSTIEGRCSRRELRIAEGLSFEVALRFDEPLRLADLASAVGVSPFHACHVFRRARGCTIHRHLTEVRLRHALSMVLDTDWPLARVALEAGFSSHGHFGTWFRRRFGATPTEVRRGGPVLE